MVEPARVVVNPGVQTFNLQLKVVSVAQQVTVEERAALVTPEPANNASATVLRGDDLQALSDNPDDLIAELMAIAGTGGGLGGASVFIDGFTGGQIPSKESIREVRINQNPFAPEYERPGNGRIEISTKRVGVDRHGVTPSFGDFARQPLRRMRDFLPRSVVERDDEMKLGVSPGQFFGFVQKRADVRLQSVAFADHPHPDRPFSGSLV